MGLSRACCLLLTVLALGNPVRGDVLGTDFDSMPIGSYPFGTPGAIELVRGVASRVSIATLDDVPRGYQEFATADWIRSGQFLVVDTRGTGPITLRVAFCCGSGDGGCVLRYDRLRIAGSARLRHYGRARDVRRDPNPCSVVSLREEIHIEPNSLALLDNFWAEVTPEGKRPGVDFNEDHKYGGEFLGTDFDSLRAGLFPLDTESHVRLLQGKASSVRALPAHSTYLGHRMNGKGNCICIGADDSSDTAVAIDFRLEDDPSAWCRFEFMGHPREEEGVEFSVAGDPRYVPSWARGDRTRMSLGLADGREHTLIVRVPGGSVLCMDHMRIVLRPRLVSPKWQLTKAAADSLVSAWGPDAAYRYALGHFDGTFEDQHRAAVVVLAAFGQATSLWENLGWEKAVRGVRSRDGSFCLIRTTLEGEGGQFAEAEFCLIEAGKGVRWVRSVQAPGTARVSNAGTAVLSQIHGETVELEFVDAAGALVAARSWPRTWRGTALFGDAEALELAPDGGTCLMTVHGGDSKRTLLHALDLSGNDRWAFDLDEMVGIPTISFTPDGRLILVEGSHRRSGRGKRVIALSLDGRLVRSP